MRWLSSLRPLMTISALSVLAACSILPKSEPVQVYLLPSQSAPASAVSSVSWSLRLNTPQTSQALNSARIAVLPTANEFSTYAGSSWSDAAPRLLRNHLLNAFQNDGRVRALSSDDDNLQADLQLGGELQAFQSEYHEGSVSVALGDLDGDGVLDLVVGAGKDYAPEIVACDAIMVAAVASATRPAGSGRRDATSAGRCSAASSTSSEPHHFWIACRAAVAASGVQPNARETVDG